jgi:hypothetical protein
MGYLNDFKKIEDNFADSIRSLGEIKNATQTEDINEHWDIKLSLRFDVKAIKKVNRFDDKPNENIHWVELRNVNGDRGWLYGDAEYFVFEVDDYWILVEKISLQDLIANKCKTKEYSSTPSLYKLYKREGRKDIITLVKTLDLVYIAEKLIKK